MVTKRTSEQFLRRVVSVALITLFFFIAPIVTSAAESIVAHDFYLPDIFNGNSNYALSDFQGKVVLLNIWASWCSGCKKEMPLFQNVQDIYKNKGFTFVAVNIDDNKKNALKFLNKLEKKTGMKINFPVLYDKDKSLAKKYNPIGLPASYLIDNNGIIVRRYYGSFDNANIRKLTMSLDEVLGNDK